MDDVFVIQDEIAQAVVAGLRVRLLDEIPSIDRTTPEAYALYLQAVQLINLRNAESTLKAESLLLKVLEIDSDYVAALLNLASAYRIGGSTGAWHPNQSFPKARNATVEVLRVDADNVPALLILANIALRYDYDVESTMEYLSQAELVSPTDDGVRGLASQIALRSGDSETAIGLQEFAVERDPADTNARYFLGLSYFTARHFNKAKRSLKKAIELSPTIAGAHFYVGTIEMLEGNYNAALAQIELETRDGYEATGRALLYHARGDSEQADRALQELLVLGVRWTYQIAAVYAFRNEADEAFLWLDRAIDRRDTSLALLRGNPLMDNIRDDPRLNAVYARLGIEPQ